MCVRAAFSYLLLGALHGWGDANGDKKVTAQEAYEYTRDVLTTVVKDRDHVPSLDAAKSDVVLATGAADKGPDLVDIVANGL